MTPEERTAPFCEKCERPLGNHPLDKRRPPEDTVTVAENDQWTHDGRGGNVVASWRSIQPR